MADDPSLTRHLPAAPRRCWMPPREGHGDGPCAVPRRLPILRRARAHPRMDGPLALGPDPATGVGRGRVRGTPTHSGAGSRTIRALVTASPTPRRDLRRGCVEVRWRGVAPWCFGGRPPGRDVAEAGAARQPPHEPAQARGEFAPCAAEPARPAGGRLADPTIQVACRRSSDRWCTMKRPSVSDHIRPTASRLGCGEAVSRCSLRSPSAARTRRSAASMHRRCHPRGRSPTGMASNYLITTMVSPASSRGCLVTSRHIGHQGPARIGVARGRMTDGPPCTPLLDRSGREPVVRDARYPTRIRS